MTAELTAESLLDRPGPGSTVMVAGPPMTDKFDLMLRLLGSASDGHVVATTKHTVEDVRAAADEAMDSADPGLVGIVECLGGAGAPPGSNTPGAGLTVRSVSPSNLTGIGVGIVDALEACDAAGSRHPGLGLHSLSALLMHTDLNRVYRFVGEIAGSLRRWDGTGVFVIDSTGTEPDVLSTLSQHADGVLRTRRRDDGRELRGRGSLGPTEWCQY